MQDEVNSKVVAMYIRLGKSGGRLTANVLKAAMRKFLKEHDRQKNYHMQEKARERAEPTHGKQTVL